MSNTIPLRDHIAIRLTDFRGDGTKIIVTEFQTITRRQSAAGMLASGNTIVALENAIEESYRATLNQGASFIVEAAEGRFHDYIDLLIPFAHTFQADLLRAYDDVFGRLGMRGGEPSFRGRSADVMPRLAMIRDRIIGDFKIGIVGGKRVTGTKNQNIADFSGATINAPISFSQSITQTGLDADAVKFLTEMLRPEVLAELPNELRDEVKDAAEAARDELAKTPPDQGKIMRRFVAIARYAGQLGKSMLEAAAKEFAKQYAQQAGLPPPIV